MATKRRFGIGDEVRQGHVRLIDVEGPAITIELLATGTAHASQSARHREVELVGKAPPAPKGRHKPLL